LELLPENRGVQTFPKNHEWPLHARHRNGSMWHVPYYGRTDIRRHYSRNGDMAARHHSPG